MAKNPRVQDPADAALSAIEEALNLGAPAASDARPDKLPDADEGFVLPREPVQEDGPLRGPAERGTAFGSRRTPANDDRESVGQMLYMLQQRPPSTAYWITGLLALVWLVAGLALLHISFDLPLISLLSGSTYRDIPGVLGALVAVVLPPLFFLVLGALIWRIQEMRYVARSMSQVAFRLVEPETIASDSIASVGQAIRREVAAMGDGIDRALARASARSMPSPMAATSRRIA